MNENSRWTGLEKRRLFYGIERTAESRVDGADTGPRCIDAGGMSTAQVRVLWSSSGRQKCLRQWQMVCLHDWVDCSRRDKGRTREVIRRRSDVSPMLRWHWAHRNTPWRHKIAKEPHQGGPGGSRTDLLTLPIDRSRRHRRRSRAAPREATEAVQACCCPVRVLSHFPGPGPTATAARTDSQSDGGAHHSTKLSLRLPCGRISQNNFPEDAVLTITHLLAVCGCLVASSDFLARPSHRCICTRQEPEIVAIRHVGQGAGWRGPRLGAPRSLHRHGSWSDVARASTVFGQSASEFAGLRLT